MSALKNIRIMWNKLLFEYRTGERMVRIYGNSSSDNLRNNRWSGCLNESPVDEVLPALGKDKRERDQRVKGTERRVASIH